METPAINFEENKSKFEEIQSFCKDEKEFNDIVMKISLLEAILGQVNEIFIGSLYSKEAYALIDAANASVSRLQNEVVDIYIKNSKDLGELMPVPDVAEISSWVEEIHFDIAKQLYSEGFCDSVIYPALQTVTQSVIEFAEEESQESNNTTNEPEDQNLEGEK